MHRTSPSRTHGTAQGRQYTDHGRKASTTHDEAFVPDCLREVAIECHSIIVGVVALFSDDVLEKGSLMAKDLGQSSAEET